MLCLKKHISPILVTIETEICHLKAEGWIQETANTLTPKAIKYIKETENHLKLAKKGLNQDAIDYIEKYRSLFPKITLPSGVPARVNKKELEKKFSWFINTYDFTWETILKATKTYIEKYETKGFWYMQNSSYFISRMDKDKNISSSLATACENMMEGIDQQEIATDSKFNIV
jgi:hypothetical protein